MQEQSLFIAALEIAGPAEQAAFLERACAGDVALRQRIERLLQCHQQDDSFLQGAAPPLGATSAHASSAEAGSALAERPGTIIGPYKLLEQIGEGGFGLVFMAEQQQPVRRKVAVKVLKPGMDSRQVIARFEAERQALALMDHPNIARVLDAGETASGRPHFVMELVKGVSITDYCDENRLSTRERLELFTHVCQAVQHAHHKGVIHRDIKPSNVMVTLHDDVPVVKVIDFGIAKALGQQLTDKTLVTGFAQMVGTPLYMSPEQAQLSGLDIDTRSDIYSLGVLLYELLTGTTPFDKERLGQASYDEMRRVIREEEPPRPSNRLSTLGSAAVTVSERRQSDPRRLSQLLRGELDWIVMKALEKERSRRYESASAFAADVERNLADEPVLACPPSAWYRFRKFARRNKSALVVAVCLLLVVTAVGASAAWFTRDRAARRAQSMGRVQDGLTAARTLLADNKPVQARQKIAEVSAEIGNNRAFMEALAAQVDAVERELDRWQAFFNLIDQAHEAEIVEAKWLPAQAVPFVLDALAQYDVLDRDDWSARLEHGLLGKEQVQEVRRRGYEQLLWLADDVLRRRQEHHSGAQLSIQAAAKAASAYLQKAESARPPTSAFYRLRARSHQALGDKELAAADRKLAQETPPTMACDYYLQGQAAYAARKRAEGVQAFEAALCLEPKHYRSLEMLGYCLCDLGQESQDFSAAAVAFTGCIMMRPDYAHVHYCRGVARFKLRQWDKAIADYTKAIELDPKNALAWNNRGYAYIQVGQSERALGDCTKAIELNPKYVKPWNNRGAAYSNLKQWDKAVADWTKAVELDPKGVRAWDNRGRAYANLKQWDKAIADYTRAVKLDPTLAPGMWTKRGWAYAQLEEWDKAVADYTKAAELDPKNARAWTNRGDVYSGLKQWDKAIADYARAVKLDPTLAPGMWTKRGWAYAQLEEWDKALADFTRAVELDSKDGSVWHHRGWAYANLKQWDKAVADYTRAIELNPKEVSAWGNRGNAYSALKQWEQALADCSKAIELNSKLAFAWGNRGRVYSELKQWDQALADCSKAIELAPGDATAWNNRSVVYSELKQWDQALADCSKTIELDPKSAPAWNNRGSAYWNLKQWDKALADYSKAIELDPKDAKTWNNRGAVYGNLKQWDKAIADSTKAVELDPKFAMAWYNRGAVYAHLKQWDKALADSTKAIELDPKFAMAWYNRGYAYLRLKQWGKAIANYSKAIDLDPKNADRYNHLAWLLATCSDPKFRDSRRAVDAAKKALELSPKEGSCWQTLAWAQYRAGNWKAAVTAMEKVKELGSAGDSSEWFLLAMAHWQLANNDQARRWYDRAVTWMDKNNPKDDELRRFRTEAAELLKIKKGQ